jgi:hypothetical protein
MHPLTEGYTFPKGMKHNLNKKSKMEDNLSELGKPQRLESGSRFDPAGLRNPKGERKPEDRR